MPILYQKEWNGIDLVSISLQPGTMAGGEPTENFYRAFYLEMQQRGFAFSENWFEEKRKIAGALKTEIERISILLNKNPKELRVLSIGSGLGVVELELLKQNFNIALHEIQEISLNYVLQQCEKLKCVKPKILLGLVQDFEDLNYDLVYLGCMEYSFRNDQKFCGFLRDLKTKFNPDTFLWSWEPAPNFKHYVVDCAIQLKIKPQNAVAWGNLRTLSRRVELYKKAGFKNISFNPNLLMPGKEQVLISAKKLNTLFQFGKNKVSSLHAQI